MKKFLISLCSVLMIAVATFCGCGNNTDKSLTGFTKLNDLDVASVTSIWVTDEGANKFFAIKDSAQVSHIMEGLTSKKAFIKQEKKTDGGNILLMFYNADDYLDSIFLYNVEEGEESYELADKELLTYILNCENREYKSLSDFSKFKDKDLNTVTKIKVRWSDTGGPTFTEFFIEGENAKALMDKMTDAKAFVSHDGMFYGNNDTLEFYAGEEKLGSIGFANINDGEESERLFRFSSDEIFDYIKNYMKENGLK